MAISEKKWDQLILLVISAAGNGGSQAPSNTACTFLVLCRNLRGKIHIWGKKTYRANCLGLSTYLDLLPPSQRQERNQTGFGKAEGREKNQKDFP